MNGSTGTAMMGSRRGGGGGGGGGWCLVMFAVVSALCVSGPALYWKLNKSIPHHQQQLQHHASAACPTCSCHCPPPHSLLQIAPGLANLSVIVADCGASDPNLNKEMRKQFVDLLTEELKLQQGVAAEHGQHMNLTLTDARRVASQYQREADKCVAATETCESARERSEAFLSKEIKLTLLWESRALNLGWQSQSQSQSQSQ